MHHPTDRITHTTAFVTPVMEHWLEREIAQWMIDPTTHRTMSERSYHRATARSLPRTESLAMPEADPVSRRVRNLNVYGHLNNVSYSYNRNLPNVTFNNRKSYNKISYYFSMLSTHFYQQLYLHQK